MPDISSPADRGHAWEHADSRHSALLIVDVQNDFCSGGALAVPNSEQVVSALNQYIRDAVARGILVYASRDWHPAVSTHFAPHGGQWPVHCVENTVGARFHSALNLPPTTTVISKGNGPDAPGYSAFEGCTEDGTPLLERLRADGVTHLFVGGLATDYCVRASVLDALSAHLTVTILRDAIAGVDLRPGDSDRAIAEMRQRGATSAKGPGAVAAATASPQEAHMVEVREILCPIDFSDFSRRALDHAVTIARWYGSRVTLLHIYNILPVVSYAPGGELLPATPMLCPDRDALLTSMQQFADAEVGSSVPITCDAGEGDVAAEILARSRAMASDLIVMGTHGRSGFERLVLGSVTEKVLRKATCPVLSVPRTIPEAVPVPPVLFKRILCAIDFSDCAMHALTYAMSLAVEAHAALTVIHVIELPPDVTDIHETVLGGPRSLREYIALAEADRRERLKDAVPEAVRASCAVDTVLATGKPYREILRVAAEQAADLIVIGIHGRSAPDLLFFGSTAQHLVRRASCSVLTLRKE